MNLKFLAAGAALFAATLGAFADTAGLFDLVVGFKQNGAANDVMIDFGNVNQYDFANSSGLANFDAGTHTYTLGNYDGILSANFGGSAWSTSAVLNWGAAASYKDPGFNLPNQQWVTKQRDTTTGTLGEQHSTAWTPRSNGQLSGSHLRINHVYTGIGTYAVGVAVAISATDANSWRTATTPSNLAFGVYAPATQFNNNMARLEAGMKYSASDLYQVGNLNAFESEEERLTKFAGTLALYQDGTLTFTVIPEPSTYAAILGVAALGFAAMRRRQRRIERQSDVPGGAEAAAVSR